MKILIASDTYYPHINGAAIFTCRLAKMLAKRGHQVFVMAPSSNTKVNITSDEGVTVYGLPSVDILVYPKFRVSPEILAKRPIRKLLKEINPEIIHIQNHFMIGKAVVSAAKNLNLPIVGTNHFMPENLVHYLHLPKLAEDKLKRIGWDQFLKVYSQLDIVTAPTRTAADLVEKSGLKKKVIPISCGIDLARFNPNNDGLAMKKKYGVPSDRLIMLYVGRLEKEKRISVIINALPAIIKTVNAHLVIAGTGKQGASLAVLVKKSGLADRVTFTGFVADQDLPNFYRAADLFVIAGIAELQSIVTMEAMASGLPVAAVDVMALPELVHHGENGYLFKEDDSGGLAEAAIKILSDEKLRERMGRKSLEIIGNHDIDKIIDKFEAVYRRAIDLRQNKPETGADKRPINSRKKIVPIVLSGVSLAALAITLILAIYNIGLQEIKTSSDLFAEKIQQKISTSENIKTIKSNLETLESVIEPKP